MRRDGRVVDVRQRRAGLAEVEGGLLRGEHHLVHRAAFSGEAPADGVGPRHVRRVAFELAAGVDQYELAVAQGLVVGDVVEHGRVAPPADDRGVGGARGAAPPEDVLDRRLELVLVGSVACELRRRRVGLAGDRRSAPHDVDLGRLLLHPHLVDDGARVEDRVRGHDALARAPAHVLERLDDLGVDGGVATEDVVDPLRLGEDLGPDATGTRRSRRPRRRRSPGRRLRCRAGSPSTSRSRGCGAPRRG